MSFLIEPIADLTVPLYNIALGAPAKRQQETEKFILAILRTGVAAIVFFSVRQGCLAKNDSVSFMLCSVSLMLFSVHPYSGYLGVVNWCAFRGVRSLPLTQSLWLKKAIDMTAVVTGLWSASKLKIKLPHGARLDPYLVGFSKTISSRLFNNRSA